MQPKPQDMQETPNNGQPAELPKTPVRNWMRPLIKFLHVEAASGGVLLACTVAALIVANSVWEQAFTDFWQTRVGFAVGEFELFKPLLLWVNDGLMTIFFFVVGLEIKREVVEGELREPRKAALPIIAALGGMVVPAGIYLAFQAGQPGEAGWGIPMATDIAFVVGFLALLGARVPSGFKILLLTLAIADDIGAVLVIAIFYTEDISLVALRLGLLGFAVTYMFNLIGVRWIPIYVCLGAAIWLAFLKSGVHPTVAGVLLGMLTPASAWISEHTLKDVLSDATQRLNEQKDEGATHDQDAMLHRVSLAAKEAISPLDRLEASLHVWVAFLIMPIFALANAGVRLNLASLTEPVALAVGAGLVLGKPLGIVLFSWVAVKAGLARLPHRVTWTILIGGGCLAGIGFTMSLFIAGLALKEPALLEAGKTGTLIGSAISAIVGCTWLICVLPRSRERQRAEGTTH